MMPKDDTAVSLARFWLFSKLLRCAMRVAPDGDSKRLLSIKIGEWVTENERQWYARYPAKPKAQ